MFVVILEKTSSGPTVSGFRGRGRSLSHALDRYCVGCDHCNSRVSLREGEIRTGMYYVGSKSKL